MRDGQQRARTRDPWRQWGLSWGGGKAIWRHSILSQKQPPVSRDTRAEDGNKRDLSEADVPGMASLQKGRSPPSSHSSPWCFSEHIAGGSYSFPLGSPQSDGPSWHTLPHILVNYSPTEIPKATNEPRAYVCVRTLIVLRDS